MVHVLQNKKTVKSVKLSCNLERASVLLSEGHWFDSPSLHVKVALGKIVNPKLLLMNWSAATAISVRMSVWTTASHFGQKHLLNVLH